MLHDLCYLALLLAHLVWVRYQGGSYGYDDDGEVDNDYARCDVGKKDEHDDNDMNEGTSVSVHDADA